jgi:hypothetical protein
MKSQDLTQAEVEQLDPNDYSNYLAYGSVLQPDLSDDEYEDYLKSYQMFDL